MLGVGGVGGVGHGLPVKSKNSVMSGSLPGAPFIRALFANEWEQALTARAKIASEIAKFLPAALGPPLRFWLFEINNLPASH